MGTRDERGVGGIRLVNHPACSGSAVDHVTHCFDHDYVLNHTTRLGARWLRGGDVPSLFGDLSVGECVGPRLAAIDVCRPFTDAEVSRYSEFLNTWPAIPAVFRARDEAWSVAARDGSAWVGLSPLTACPHSGEAHDGTPAICLRVDDRRMRA